MAQVPRMKVASALATLLFLAACGSGSGDPGVDGQQQEAEAPADQGSDDNGSADNGSGNSQNDDSDEEENGDSDKGQNGDSDEEENGDGPDVVTSPLRVPLPINVVSGQPYDVGLPRLQEQIASVCEGGEQCIGVEKVGLGTTPDPDKPCDVIDTVEGTQFDEDNQPYVELRPDDTMRVLVNVRCEDLPDSGLVTSPLRVPLPLDELRGRDSTSGIADVQQGIAETCGGDQCVGVEKVVVNASPTDGAVVCQELIEQVQGVLRDADDNPFVEVERGGTITLEVRIECQFATDQSSETSGSP